MTYQIIYTKNNETITLEWISPAAIRECFEHRFPQAEIISIEAVQ